MNSNDKQFIAQEIRSKYAEKQATELDALKKLDKKATRPANIFAYIFGSVSALVMGAGMSLVMTDIAQKLSVSDPMLVGVCVGIAGMAMAIINYPIYKAVLNHRRKKYAKSIFELSDKIVGNK